MTARLAAMGVLVGLIAAACAAGSAASTPPAGAVRASAGDGPSVELSLTAKGIAFQPTVLTILAGNSLIVAFDNLDPGVGHELVLYADPAGQIELARAPIVMGPDHARFRIVPLIAGRYRFGCLIHPQMEAGLVVQPS